jgi:hypothetical protein
MIRQCEEVRGRKIYCRGESPSVFKVGDVMISEPNSFFWTSHRWSGRLYDLRVLQQSAASHEAILDLASGTVKFDVSRPGEFRRMMEAQRVIRKPTA